MLYGSVFMGRRLITATYYTPFRPFDCSALRAHVLIFLTRGRRRDGAQRVSRACNVRLWRSNGLFSHAKADAQREGRSSFIVGLVDFHRKNHSVPYLTCCSINDQPRQGRSDPNKLELCEEIFE